MKENQQVALGVGADVVAVLGLHRHIGANHREAALSQADAGEAELINKLFFARSIYHDPEAMARCQTLHSIFS